MSVPGPVLGPCTSWCSADDVACCCGADLETVGPALLDTAALEASMALYELSGRKFSGLCTRTVRPCRDACACWGNSTFGLGPWYWTSAAWGYAPSGWWWYNECGDRAGCGATSQVPLAGYPVREILEVKIDGAVLDPLDANGNPNYRLDGWRTLTRMDDPGPPIVTRRFPHCQSMALDDDQPGTFSISYSFGVDPPQLGIDAAAELACELYKACSGEACALPANATRVTRQGIQIERSVVLALLAEPSKPTGLLHLDLFLAAYSQKTKVRRPALFSPDVTAYAKKLGS